MKKRLISMLLSVLLVVSLFAGYSLSASADTVSYNTMTYRMASGDYVLRICQRLGLNYYVCKDAIMKLNSIKENQWRFLPVGKLLTLPATDADAVVITTGRGSTATANAATAAATASTAASTASTTTSSSTSTAKKSTADELISKDTPIWYMIPYTLANGETVSDACASLGISFSKYKYAIERVNNIKNWGNIPAGTTLWLASGTAPAPGTNCIIIYRHIMQSGETAYGVATERGLNYNAAKWLLEIVNEVYPDLASIKAGQRFDYPISTTIPLVSANATTAAESKDTKYKLTSGIETGAATVEFFVGNTRVTEAKAGDTVRIDINTKNGRALKNIVLKYANGQADMQLSSFSFVMPKCDVRVDAEFQTGHKIEIKSNYADKAVTLVNGVAVNGAAKGAGVVVSCLDPAMAVDELYISYMTLGGLKREAVTNIDNGFVMPDADVTVEVFLKAVPTYALFIEDFIPNPVPNPIPPVNGTFSLQVNGNNVTRAARGAQVTIVPKPYAGFTVGNIQFFNPTTGLQDNTIGVFNNTFTMPARDVGVVVTFIGRANNILMNPVEGGQFYATLGAADVAFPNPSTIANRDANAVDEAPTNAIVYLNWVPEQAGGAGYTMSSNVDDYIVTRNSDGLRVKVTRDGTGVWFRMPSGGVTVTGGVQRGAVSYTARVYLDNVQIPDQTFRGVSLYTKGDFAGQRTEFQDGFPGPDAATAAVAAQVGEYINVSYNGGEHIALARYEVWDQAEAQQLNALSDELRVNGCFQMPNQPVVIRAYFSSDTVKIAAADKKITGKGTVGMLSLLPGADPTVAANWSSVDGVKVGEPFALSLSPSEGYFFNTNPADGKVRLLVSRKDNGGEIALTQDGNPNPIPGIDGELIFRFDAMPDCGAKVEVTFDKIAYWVQILTVDEMNAPLNAGGFWKLTVNKKDTLIENSITDVNLEYGDSVTMDLTEAGASKFKFVKSIINDVTSTKNVGFTLSGELARAADQLNQNGQPLTITIVLRPLELTGKKNPIALRATYNDAKRGNAGFVILASPTGYSVVDPTAFVTTAYAGDTVGIIPQPVTPNMYNTDAANIRVNLAGGKYIEPTPVDDNGDGVPEMYTFVMPEGGYSSIKVDFVPVKYSLTIVTDPANAAKGLFQVKYSDGATNNDVLLEDSFKTAPYGSVVKVTITDAGKAAGVHIDAAQSIASINPPSAEAKSISGGFQFKMPAGPTSLTVFLLDKNNTTTDVPTVVAPPAPKTTTMPSQTTGGTEASYYSDPEKNNVINDPVDVTEGDTVYVVIDESGLTDGQYIEKAEFLDTNGDPVGEVGSDGSYTVTGDESTLKVTVGNKKYTLQLKVENAPADLTSITINGNPVGAAGGTLSPLKHGDTVTITVDGSENIKTVTGLDSPSGEGTKTVSGAFKPAKSVPDGATVDVTISFNQYYKLQVTLVNAEEGDSIKVGDTTITESGMMVNYAYLAGDVVNFSNASRTITGFDGLDSANTSIDSSGTSGQSKIPAAPDSSTIPVTVTFEKLKCTIETSDQEGKTVSYFKPDNTALSGNKVEKGYTVTVKGDPGVAATYVESITITDVNGNVTTIEDGGSYTVEANMKTVEVKRSFKLLKVKFNVTVPKNTDYQLYLDDGSGYKVVSNPIVGVKYGDKVKLVAAYAKIGPYSESTGQISLHALSDSTIEGTVDPKNSTKNGDTITVPVELVALP